MDLDETIADEPKGDKVDLRFELPVEYDADSQSIYSFDRQRLVDMRGFGYLTGTGGLHLDPVEAASIQDARAIYICQLINEQGQLLSRLQAERTRREQIFTELKSMLESTIGSPFDFGMAVRAWALREFASELAQDSSSTSEAELGQSADQTGE